MKKLLHYLWILVIILISCITDFTLPGIPWEKDIPLKRSYPDIAVDMTQGNPEFLPHKIGKKRLTHYDLDRKKPE